MPLSRAALAALKLATRGIHAGRTVDLGDAEPTSPPIHVATAYTYPTTVELDAVFADNSLGYVYSRYGNPTVRALEEAVAALEGAEQTVAYASGMAAIHGLVSCLAPPGTRVVASRDVYGATFALLRSILTEHGIEAVLTDMQDIDALAALVRETGPALVFAETVSNPLMRVTDIPRLAAIAHEAGAKLAIDNTFATPIVTRPLELGADAVVYSSTKHLGGHGDTTGGLVATSTAIASQLHEHNKLVGAVASPFDSWLILRGIRTLDLRVRQQCANAACLATRLRDDARIARVNYPGLGNQLPDGQFRDGLCGSMLSFEIAGAGTEDVFRFLDALRIVQPATTLGDVYTLVLHPATSSHRALSADERAAIGIPDGLVRLSAGIEDAEDILADLDQALTASSR